MDNTIQLTASSLEALNGHYEAITHNMANASTVGFKRLIQSATAEVSPQPDGEPVETIVSKTSIDFTQGPFVQTGRALDLALRGKGFFVVDSPTGPLYTRDGAFQTNAQGQVVDSTGRAASGEGGPIVVPPTLGAEHVNVATDGQVSAGGQVIGKLKIVEFADPSVLIPVGNNCFRAPEDAAPAAAAGTSVHQGYQEASNVNVVEELVSLIAVTRLYEANLKTVSAHDNGLASILRVVMG